MTRLVLVRHGESQVTVDRVVGGPRSCKGLSTFGRVQAERLHERWRSRPEFVPDAVYSSAYPRARETAEIVLPAFAGRDILIDPDLGEHDPGPDCDGLTYVEFEQKFGNPDWENDPYGITFPGGETIAQFQLRIGTAVRRLIDDHEDATVVVFCHGGVIDTVLRQALRTFGTGSFEIHTKNTSITEVELVRTGRWRLIRYNDVAHLVGLEA
ncbi:MAG: phosphoglycerate kinase [Acidimicrobiales bacterium mtb01]|nr:histidine phosphatase family protein [Actinomycetota bacterium]TEX44972.1 MAG: phosphoglycerate kinase [Acidimicrobiales bacterium mtb01]